MKKVFQYEVKRTEKYNTVLVREGFEMEVETPEDEAKFEQLKGELKIKVHNQAEKGMSVTQNPSWLTADAKKVHDMMMSSE